MESRPFLSRVPDQELIVPAYFPKPTMWLQPGVRAMPLSIFLTGWTAEIRLERLGAKTINAYWFDPTNGGVQCTREYTAELASRKFTPPSTGRGNDWILVLDDASGNSKLPANDNETGNQFIYIYLGGGRTRFDSGNSILST